MAFLSRGNAILQHREKNVEKLELTRAPGDRKKRVPSFLYEKIAKRTLRNETSTDLSKNIRNLALEAKKLGNYVNGIGLKL